MTATNGEAEDRLSRVREGMQVIDDEGNRLGRVQLVSMGDPEAATTQGQEEWDRKGTIFEQLVRAVFGPEPRIPDEFAVHLIRIGFIKIDSSGLLGKDAYAGSDQVGVVEGDMVHLNVSNEDLVYAT